MDVKEFIESGVLEEYCMGCLGAAESAFVIQVSLVYPEVKAELTRLELFLEGFAQANAIEISNEGLKQKILDAIDTSSKNLLNVEDLPLIDQQTDYQRWLQTFAHLIPAEPAEDLTFELLRRDKKVTQSLVITKIDVANETHHDILESILILTGECECTIGDDIFTAGPGRVINIPLHTAHSIRITSPYVAAVLQVVIL